MKFIDAITSKRFVIGFDLMAITFNVVLCIYNFTITQEYVMAIIQAITASILIGLVIWVWRTT